MSKSNIIVFLSSSLALLLVGGPSQASAGRLVISDQQQDAARGMLRSAARLNRDRSPVGDWLPAATPPSEQLSADDEGAQYSSCDCDCCYARSSTEGLDPEAVKKGTVVLACTPKPGANPDEQQQSQDQCGLQCAVDQEEAIQRFDSKSTVVDYARFCNLDCRPAEDIEETQCISADAAAPEAFGPPPPQSAPVVTAKMPVSSAMTQASAQSQQKQVPEGGGPSLPLAKGDMLEAMVHAKAAGEAAREAKMAYEKVLRAARVAAEASGKAVIAEIKREAGEQAKEALIVRKNYEAAAQANAVKAALGIAKVYKNALLRDQGIAGTWSMRSAEYAAAAGQRKGMALTMAKDAQNYLGSKNFEEAQAYLLQSQQAMEQARSFAGRSTAAHTQAVNINNQLKWYVWAEQAAAANALAANMPPDVAPPGMPPLP